MIQTDLTYLRVILHFCQSVSQMTGKYGNTFLAFETDVDYCHASCFCVMQIGEAITHLSDDFIKHSGSRVRWAKYKELSRKIMYGFETIDLSSVWNTIQCGLPALERYCDEIISTEEILSRVS